MFKTFDEAAAYIRERGVAMFDLKFSDLWGRWHHVTLPAKQFTHGLMEKGVGFDGSSVGFKPLAGGTWSSCPIWPPASSTPSGTCPP